MNSLVKIMCILALVLVGTFLSQNEPSAVAMMMVIVAMMIIMALPEKSEDKKEEEP